MTGWWCVLIIIILLPGNCSKWFWLSNVIKMMMRIPKKLLISLHHPSWRVFQLSWPVWFWSEKRRRIKRQGRSAGPVLRLILNKKVNWDYVHSSLWLLCCLCKFEQNTDFWHDAADKQVCVLNRYIMIIMLNHQNPNHVYWKRWKKWVCHDWPKKGFFSQTNNWLKFWRKREKKVFAR